MNLSRLRYFNKLAELLNYTEAARELYISQPTLSAAIARLEEELGVPLFERTSRAIRLTVFGQEYYRFTSQAIELLDKATDSVQKLASQRLGSIRIGTLYLLQHDWLPALLRDYRAIRKDAPSIEVTQGLSHSLIEALENETYDLVLSSDTTSRPGYCSIPILSQHLAVLLRASHPLSRHATLLLADLRDQRVIMCRTNDSLETAIEALMNERGLKVSVQAKDESVFISMLKADVGAVGLTLDSAEIAYTENLIKLPIRDTPDGFYPIYLSFKQSSLNIPSLRLLIDQIKATSPGID
jgi:DNA-binding transcriptional LysR family regulator